MFVGIPKYWSMMAYMIVYSEYAWYMYFMLIDTIVRIEAPTEAEMEEKKKVAFYND